MKKRTKVLTVTQVALLMSLSACSNEKPLPNNMDVEKEISQSAPTTTGSNSFGSNMLLYYLLFSRSGSPVVSNNAHRFHDRDRTKQGSYGAGFVAARGSSWSRSTTKGFTTSGKAISRGGFGSSAKGFSARS